METVEYLIKGPTQ